MRFSYLLPKQAVGADELAIGQSDCIWCGHIRCLNDEKVIADRIEAVAVDMASICVTAGAGAKFFIKYPVAEALAGCDFLRADSLTQDQRAPGDANVCRMRQVRSLLKKCLPQTPGF